MVTIVTPTREAAEFLPAAMRSVAFQDHPAIEYMVVDGGHDTETPQLVEAMGPKVQRYLRGPDRGQADAINKGFRAATGEILAWLNADDYYFPDAVASACAAFRDAPELDVLYGDAVFCDRSGQFLRYFSEVEPFDAQRIVASSNYLCQPSVFFRRAALERVGFLDDTLHYVMDWDLWCRFARAGCRFQYLRRPLAVNREYQGTKTRAGGWRRMREIARIQRRHLGRRLPRGLANHLVWELDQHFGIGASLPESLRRLAGGIKGAKRRLLGRATIRPLYGFLHHDQGVQAQAEIRLPLPGGPVRQIVLRAEFPGPGTQTVVLRGDGGGGDPRSGWGGRGPALRAADLELGRMVLPGGAGPLDFQFSMGEVSGALVIRFQSENRFRRAGHEAAWLLHRFQVR